MQNTYGLMAGPSLSAGHKGFDQLSSPTAPLMDVLQTAILQQCSYFASQVEWCGQLVFAVHVRHSILSDSLNLPYFTPIDR